MAFKKQRRRKRKNGQSANGQGLSTHGLHEDARPPSKTRKGGRRQERIPDSVLSERIRDEIRRAERKRGHASAFSSGRVRFTTGIACRVDNND